MDSNTSQTTLQQEIEKLTQQIWQLAYQYKYDIFAVLLVLRELEKLHRKIREEMFEPSLPDTRHQLYLLLKHIDEVGGWPYIERMKLREICKNILKKETENEGDNQT
ncbi:MAG TPA: hypothetical protein IGQ44_11780 [Geminocystis sp. M7585_C2015_104]|nr:hypothetical protein [Geminocystis sp. M7585_C2015_104]